MQNVDVQGTSAPQTSFSSDLTAKIGSWGFLVVIFLLLLSATGAFSQNYDSLSTSAYHYEIIAPSGLLDQGESAVFEVHLGTSSTPVEDLIGLDLQFTLSDQVDVSATPSANPTGDWELETPVVDQSNPNQPLLSISADPANNEASSQSELLLTITLTANEDGTDPTTMITDGGGLLIIVDAGFKRPILTQEEKKPLFYPNPCQGNLKFQFGDTAPEQVILLDGSGHQIQLTQQALTQQQADLSGMKPGIYYLIMVYPDHKETGTLNVL